MNSKIYADALTTAFETPHLNWLVAARSPTKPFSYADPKLVITIFTDDDEEYTITQKSLNEGWEEFARVYPTRAERFLDETFDAEDADVFLQTVVFGDVIYG